MFQTTNQITMSQRNKVGFSINPSFKERLANNRVTTKYSTGSCHIVLLSLCRLLQVSRVASPESVVWDGVPKTDACLLNRFIDLGF